MCWREVFCASEKGFDLNWQLLDVNGQSVRTGGAISVASFDLIAVQTEICDEVFAELHGFGGLQVGLPGPASVTSLGDCGVGGVPAGARVAELVHVADRQQG